MRFSNIKNSSTEVETPLQWCDLLRYSAILWLNLTLYNKTWCFLRSFDNFVLTGMMCQAKTSYIETEIEWGARFEPCMTLEKGAFRVDLRRFHRTYPVPLPPYSAQDAHHLQTLQVGVELQESLKESVNWKLGADDQEDDTVKPKGACSFPIHNIQEERASEVNECDSL